MTVITRLTLNVNFHKLSSITDYFYPYTNNQVQGGSNMTGTDLYVNKPHCAAAVRP